MAYENVTPPTLPEYDSTTYPYYLLYFNFDEGETDWNSVNLMYADSPFVYDSESKCINGSVATFGWWLWDYYDESWSDMNGRGLQEWGLELNLSPGLSEGIFHRIYTNHDILDSKGNVYLAADCVTPVSTFDLRSWLVGYTLGICGKPLPLSTAKKEPIAYSYNGVVLPKLPEWDKTVYPYVYIDANAYPSVKEYNRWKLYCFDRPVKYGQHSLGFEGRYYFIVDAPWTAISFECTFDQETAEYLSWFYSVPVEIGKWFQAEANSEDTRDLRISADYGCLWANHDIINTDNNSVYLAASEPIPVYE